MENFIDKKFKFNRANLINQSILFDLSCTYCISLLGKIQTDFKHFLTLSEKINKEISQKSNIDDFNRCFGFAESYLENYSKLVKSVKLSLGEKVGKIKSVEKIFNKYSYLPDIDFQRKIIHGYRNTSQHFEERLQFFSNKVEPFLSLSYSNKNIWWKISFGKDGYIFNGKLLNYETIPFDLNKLKFHSYELDRKNSNVIPISISFESVYLDIIEISKLIENNIKDKRDKTPRIGPAKMTITGMFEKP